MPKIETSNELSVWENGYYQGIFVTFRTLHKLILAGVDLESIACIVKIQYREYKEMQE